ncbi:hypothetical protein M513_04776 [Trichuris suis]|uniref:Uncharacterized protein n=1 Tax=Trichuris suis TaxID=68888 RepID=A0A085MB37_9BILA|nr:hypothetical protein M513_04776 [Trichuris suis]
MNILFSCNTLGESVIGSLHACCRTFMLSILKDFPPPIAFSSIIPSHATDKVATCYTALSLTKDRIRSPPQPATTLNKERNAVHQLGDSDVFQLDTIPRQDEPRETPLTSTRDSTLRVNGRRMMYFVCVKTRKVETCASTNDMDTLTPPKSRQNTAPPH